MTKRTPLYDEHVKLGGKIVGIVFLVDITYLKGMEKVKDYDVFSLIKF